ncbi:DUF4147 domain-containing protein [Patescibacteria group bacterium]|nr:DUF4147 domain-containing protein [Patescibacteria group bacterium]
MNKIQNFQQVARTELRKAALEIAEAGLQAIDTPSVVKNLIRLEGNALFIKEREYSLQGVERLFVVGVGKCALAAAGALEDILGEKIADGIVLDKRAGKLKRMRALQGDHPLPTERNRKATAEIIELLERATERDLVLFLVSGGGSTFLFQSETLTCLEEGAILKCLFDAGAAIQEINAIRKHLSLARGGHLAKYAYPARVLSLVFSDVPGNNLDFVASGPTFKDSSTMEDAQKILERYDVQAKCGLSEIPLLETPKEEKHFRNVENILFLSNETALQAMKEKAEELGFSPSVETAELTGDAEEVGEVIAKKLKEGALFVLLYGGETTVRVRHPGKGGRNLALGLSALRFLGEGELVFSFASDGLDNTEAAGALCDTMTREKAKEKGIKAQEYLEQNRSFEFFEETGDLVFMGPTGSNVSDLIIGLHG